MGGFLNFVGALSKGVEAVAPAVKSVAELSKVFSGGSPSKGLATTTTSAGTYNGTEMFKNPVVLIIGGVLLLVVLFWKKIKRVFR